MKPLANDFLTLYESPKPNTIFCYSPGITCSPSGRIIASFELAGDGVKEFDGAVGYRQINSKYVQGKVLISDDHGKSWTHTHDYPFMHARPFSVGDSLYILGHCGDLFIIRSDDDGQTWSAPSQLTQGEEWTQAPCNVIWTDKYVYLVMVKLTSTQDWFSNAYAPILMRAKIGEDLLQVDNWTFASTLSFRDIIPFDTPIDYMGIPFFPENTRFSATRRMPRIGWLETHVVQFSDPNHSWYDSDGHTFHLLSRSHISNTNYAAIAKVIEQPNGTMTTQLEHSVSGHPMLFVPCPGGHMKFHILYDDVSHLYWLLGSQSTDSMTRIDALAEDRYGLPYNERNRLVLHFSKNCVDWCFAGLVAIGESQLESRHYASMVIDEDSLLILSRSGDERAKSAHDGNLITLHTIENFRNLIY